MKKNLILSSDKPISYQEDDKFQRYGFAKRIAETIINRNNEDCIVIGIYGAWGEGKTSVINFINTELNKNEDIISIKFNPWRYKDEDSLLSQFFQEVALALNSSIKTNTEIIGSLFKKYGKFFKLDIPVVGVNIGETLESAGEVMENIDIETTKKRIEEILIKNNKKVVIFIDDIDRLDKNEIHSIFRLVKLTADFAKTTYILSFDEDMVSAAIGERFGEGNQKSGQNFLEKIIQVPLKIPMAQPEALKNFCFNLIDNAIEISNTKISEIEAKRFVSEFSTNILSMLNTPRLAVRYGNSLTFSLPLLEGEIDTVDLMLMEAIKIFYPYHYEFIKSNTSYFIGSYSKTFSSGKDEIKVSSLKTKLEFLNKDLTNNQKICIQSLLEELFPMLKEAFHNYYHHGKIVDKWFKNKRIASAKYLYKYFGYTVIRGEVSDVEFENFMSNIHSKTVDDIGHLIEQIIKQSSPYTFIEKVRSIEEEIDWPSSVKLAKAISIYSNLFPKKENPSAGFTFGFDTVNSQAALFIYQLIKQHNNTVEQFDLAIELMNEANPFDFAYDLNNWLRTGGIDEEKIFDIEQFRKLSKVLIYRSLKEANTDSIFEKFPKQSPYLLGCWADEDKNELHEYINKIIETDSYKVMDLILAFTPTAYSTKIIGPYKSDFTLDDYKNFISIFDKSIIYQAIQKVYKEDTINEYPVKWTRRNDEKQSNLNIIRQFLFWYKKEIEDNNS